MIVAFSSSCICIIASSLCCLVHSLIPARCASLLLHAWCASLSLEHCIISFPFAAHFLYTGSAALQHFFECPYCIVVVPKRFVLVIEHSGVLSLS